MDDADIAAVVNDYPDDRLGVCSINEALNVRLSIEKQLTQTGSAAGWEVPDEVKVSDEVVLVGRPGKEEIEVCEHSGLIQADEPEITCPFTRRVQRIYIRDGKPTYRVDYKRVESPIE